MLTDYDTRHDYGSASANGTYDSFEEPSFISVLKYRGSNYSGNIGEVLRILEVWRNKYNISVVKECERSEYCSGEFRDLILAYNSIHGYISLLVRNYFLQLNSFYVNLIFKPAASLSTVCILARIVGPIDCTYIRCVVT